MQQLHRTCEWMKEWNQNNKTKSRHIQIDAFSCLIYPSKNAMVLLNDKRWIHFIFTSWIYFSMMSSHGANPILFKKKWGSDAQNTRYSPPSLTLSNSISFLLLKSECYICITAKVPFSAFSEIFQVSCFTEHLWNIFFASCYQL